MQLFVKRDQYVSHSNNNFYCLSRILLRKHFRANFICEHGGLMQIGEYSPYIQYSVNISLIFFGVFEQVSAEELASAQSKLRKICCLKSIHIMVSKNKYTDYRHCVQTHYL